MPRPRTLLRVALLLAGLVLAGCAGPGPTLAPVAAIAEHRLDDGRVERRYDMNGDRQADYQETTAATGQITHIAYDPDQDGRFDADIELANIPEDRQHDLVMILDSVPADMIREVWDHGRLRYFSRPSRVISPFPVMTDTSLTEFFGLSPCPAVESEYFDGKRLTDGFAVYASDGNTPWRARVHTCLGPVLHARAYLDRHPWFHHELYLARVGCLSRMAAGEGCTVAYVVGTSALGAGEGRDGHLHGLVTLDRWCRQLVHDTRGQVRISLFSDHGHALVPGRRLRLGRRLEELGYRSGPILQRTGDVVVPEFGLVSCAVIHTREPAAVAGDAVNIEGIDLTVYPDGPEHLMVLGRGSRARITRRGDGFRYEPLQGDPLLLGDVVAELRRQGRLDTEGFAADADWFTATVEHVYPDPLHRLWRAFHGLVRHTPDVLVSMAEGWYAGSGLMSGLIDLKGIHGNLGRPSSLGFAASMRGPLPEVIRMVDLRAAFAGIGVRLPE